MARTTNNLILGFLRGGLGKQLVVKQYAYGTVVTKYPEMKFRKTTALGKLHQDRFREAVAYAQGILNNPSKKKAYAKTIRNGSSVYHAAIKEYLRKNQL